MHGNRTVCLFMAVLMLPLCKGFAEPYPFNDTSRSFDARVDDLVSRMTRAEKISQMGSAAPAISRLGISHYYYQNEACHGIISKGATVFPQVIGLSSTWDLDLVYSIATAISDEARAANNVCGSELTFWAPTINICRDPRWGRNEESYGEDPFLLKKCAVNFIKGMQGSHPKYLKTAATAKHFACNNTEYNRFGTSSNVDERSLREYYLPAFKAAVTEGHVSSIMSAYNALNSIPCSANRWLLTDLLRTEWGFDGMVVSDCDAIEYANTCHHYFPTFPTAAVAGCKAGCDLNCGTIYQKYLPMALQSGLWSIGDADIDSAVKRIFRVRMRLGEFDPPSAVPYTAIPGSVLNCPAHKALALKAARESIVLLKNTGLLPLDTSKIKSIAVMGPNANLCKFGGYSTNPVSSVTPLKGIIKNVGIEKVEYTLGCSLAGPRDDALFDRAVSLALKADAVIMVMGTDEFFTGENRDFWALTLPGAQEELIKEVYSANPNTIVVLVNGNPLALPWVQRNIPAIVEAWYGGEAQGTAIADVLFGNYNPGGKLTSTWVWKWDDLPDFNDYSMFNRTYMFGLKNTELPFGFGLSYTSFAYSNLRVSSASITPGTTVTVSIDVQNTGTRAGDEISQLYIHDVAASVRTALKQLKGFQRTTLLAGEKKTVSFILPYEELGFWNVKTHSFQVEDGVFDIMVGTCSEDIAEKTTITASSISPEFKMAKKGGLTIAKQSGKQKVLITCSFDGFNRICIIRPNGCVVRSFEHAGPASFSWNKATPGLYFVKTSNGSTHQVAKLVVAR